MKRSNLILSVFLATACTWSFGCGDDTLGDILDKIPTDGVSDKHDRHKLFYESCKTLCEPRVRCGTETTDQQPACISDCIAGLYEIQGDEGQKCADQVMAVDRCVGTRATCEEYKAWRTWIEEDAGEDPPPVCEGEVKIAQIICD